VHSVDHQDKRVHRTLDVVVVVVVVVVVMCAVGAVCGW